MLTLRDEGYISDKDDSEPEKTRGMRQILLDLTSSDVRQTIENGIASDQE